MMTEFLILCDLSSLRIWFLKQILLLASTSFVERQNKQNRYGDYIYYLNLLVILLSETHLYFEPNDYEEAFVCVHKKLDKMGFIYLPLGGISQ